MVTHSPPYIISVLCRLLDTQFNCVFWGHLIDYPDRKNCCLHCVIPVNPKAKSFVHERDLCDFYVFAGKYMRKALWEDIRSEVDLANTTGETGAAHDRGAEEEPGECREQIKCGRTQATGDLEGGGRMAPLRSSGAVDESVKTRDRQDPHPTGAAMKAFVKDVLPGVASLLPIFERWVRPEMTNAFTGAGFARCC